MRRFVVLVLTLAFAACEGAPTVMVPPPPPPAQPPPAPPPSPFEEFGSASFWVFPVSLNDSGEAVGVSASHSHQANVALTMAVFRDHRTSFVDTTREAHRTVINNQGRIAAAIYAVNRELVIWDANGAQRTPLPFFTSLLALQINANGAVLLADTLNEQWTRDSVIGRVSMVYRRQTVERLGSLHPTYRSTLAYAMNDQDQIVGRSATLFRTLDTPYQDGRLVYHPFIWEDGRLRDLGVFGRREEPCEWPLRWCAEGAALDINNEGVVVGYSEDSSSIRRPFIWRDGVLTDLGVFPGGAATARLINDRGLVAGDNDSLGFVWENGAVTTFSLGGPTRVIALNERGDVAGTSFSSDGKQHAFVRRDGRMMDLGIPLAGGCAAIAVDLNEIGEVLINVSMQCYPEPDGSPFVGYTGNVSHQQRAAIWHPPTP